MTKIRLHPALVEFRGGMKDMVFRQSGSRKFVSAKPNMENIRPSAAQVAMRKRFKSAAAYGKAALANPAVRALYEQASKKRDMPLFALTVADYFNAPSIEEVNLSTYHGQPGDLIQAIATDDFGVVSALVTINDDAEGTTIESGFASETGPDSGQWVYTATTAVPAGTTVNIQVVVSDRPGGTAVESVNKSL